MSDEVPPSGNDSEDRQQHRIPVKENLKTRSTWLRLFFMFVVVLLYSVSRVVVSLVVLLQFFWVLFTGETNKPLEKFGQSLATYTYQIIRYLTFNTEERPFPFDLDWPAGPPGN
jgi:Flp pilus assembly protein TadB